MAKRQKTTRFSIQGFDLNHYRATEQYAAAVQALFDRATLAIAQSAARRNIDPDKPFSFDDYPEVKTELQRVVGQLASQLQTTIETGSKKQWLFACDKNDGFLASILDTSKLSKARLKKMQDRNLDALSTFQGRKVGGMDLSQRVWRYVGQFRDQLETALDVGLGEGRSAQQLARDVKQNLREPDRLFRRVRDKRGNLVLSKAARAFHPGQGVYRSSVKNAQRLTRSEINMAYRESDFLRWQQLDFVVGFEIHRSNHEPLCKCKMCDRLQGRYPKTFKFKGWHPQCMCYAVPILMDEETFDENELGDLKAALRGTEYKKKQSRNLVTDVPDGFKEWVAENMKASAGWASTPYFIKDNFVDGDLAKGLKIALPTVEPDVPDVPKFNYDSPNDALEAYIGGDMMWINQYLRGRGDFGELSAKEKQYLEELKRVTQSDVVGERTLWRSVDARAIFGDMSDITFTALEDYFLYGDTSKPTMQRIQRLLGIEGKEIIEKGFMSTTKDHDIAADWGDYTGADYPILMKIRTTAKTRGVDVERYTKIHNPEAEEDNPQAEILLNCNQRFRIVSVSKDGGNICVEVELIDEEQVKQAKPKIDPVQAQLDALMPSIEAARKVADEWGLTIQRSTLDKAVANREVNKIDERIATITQKANELLAMLSKFVKDVADVTKNATEQGVDVKKLPAFAVVTQNLMAAQADKKNWKNNFGSYQNNLESLKRAIQDELLRRKQEEEKKKSAATTEASMDDWRKRTEEAGEITKSENDKEIEKVLGIEKGVDMTFDEANELRGNPNYCEEYIECSEKEATHRMTKADGTKVFVRKNPAYKKKFTINCQSCVVANEMRRRGFDVQAIGKTKDSIPAILSRHTELAWLDEDGNTPTSKSVGWVYSPGDDDATAASLLGNLETATKEVGRYHIKWTWNTMRSGHIITCERLKDGTLRIYDPQCGEVISDFATYGKRFLHGSLKVLRVDTLRINPLYSGCLKGNKTKKTKKKK